MRLCDIDVGTRIRVKDRYNYRFNKTGVVIKKREYVIGQKIEVKADDGEVFEIDLMQVEGIDENKEVKSPTPETKPEAEYYAIYQSRLDGDWELYMVYSKGRVEDDPQGLDVFLDDDDWKVVEGGDCDFPSVYSETESE